MDDERLLRIESKIGFLEHTVDQLDEVILDLRGQLDRMEKAVAEIRERLDAGGDGSIDASFRRPPHY